MMFEQAGRAFAENIVKISLHLSRWLDISIERGRPPLQTIIGAHMSADEEAALLRAQVVARIEIIATMFSHVS